METAVEWRLKASCPEQVWLALRGEAELMTASSGSEFCDLNNTIRAFTLPGYFMCSLTHPHPSASVKFTVCHFLTQ